MAWVLTLLGASVAIGLLLAVAAKWKLPRGLARSGILITAMIVSLPFGWVYAHLHAGIAVVLVEIVQVAASLAVAFALALIAFWRDPERVPPTEPGSILSAADGEVLAVVEVDPGSTPLVRKSGREYSLVELTGGDFMADGATVISVEMNLLNVHVNRCPIAGHADLLQPIHGQFLSLRRAEAPFVNERFTTLIRGAGISVAVVQISSRLVRRIENYLSPGQPVSAGQRLGRIRFGSQVVVVLPRRADIQILIKPGDTVHAGVTILARHEVNAS